MNKQNCYRPRAMNTLKQFRPSQNTSPAPAEAVARHHWAKNLRATPASFLLPFVHTTISGFAVEFFNAGQWKWSWWWLNLASKRKIIFQQTATEGKDWMGNTKAQKQWFKGLTEINPLHFKQSQKKSDATNIDQKFLKSLHYWPLHLNWTMEQDPVSVPQLCNVQMSYMECLHLIRCEEGVARSRHSFRCRWCCPTTSCRMFSMNCNASLPTRQAELEKCQQQKLHPPELEEPLAASTFHTHGIYQGVPWWNEITSVCRCLYSFNTFRLQNQHWPRGHASTTGSTLVFSIFSVAERSGEDRGNVSPKMFASFPLIQKWCEHLAEE